MADYILLDSPLIENAVKITADVKNAPRRFGRSSLKDTPVVSGGASDEYNGYFKIVPKGTNEIGGAVFEIVNGHNPENQYCGHTDVPGCESVAKTTFAVYEGSVRVSLEVRAIRDNDENNTLYYEVVFHTDNHGVHGFESVLIGYAYEDGKVEQAYKEDATIRIRRDWYL